MGLIIERHSSDLIKTSKIKVVIDGKIKYRLLPGESAEADIDDGLHKIECSLNLMKAFAEINYPRDNRIVVFYRPSPAGISIQSVPAEEKSKPPCGCVFCFQSALNGDPGEIFVMPDELIFKKSGCDFFSVKYCRIAAVKSSLGNPEIRLYSGKTYTFILPKEQSKAVLDFVAEKVKACFDELHSGFDLRFGTEAFIYVNEKDETFYIQNGGAASEIYRLEQILSYGAGEVSAKQNFIGDAALGSLIDGARGAFFGALHAAECGNKVEEIRLDLTVKTETDIKAFSLCFAEPLFAMERGGKKYNAAMTECQKFIAFMDCYTKKKSKAEFFAAASEPKSADADPAEELRKYRALFDEGIIDESEFKAKKKQLLNI